MSRKSEYHSRVSPIVRRGGRSKVAHSIAIKMANVVMAAALHTMAILLRSQLIAARIAAVSDSAKTIIATHRNMFQPNSMLPMLSICCLARATNK